MRSLIVLTAGLAAGLTACGTSEPAAEVEKTGAALSVDYFGDTDVVGFHFVVKSVACDVGDTHPQKVLKFNVDLVDGIFPGNISFIAQTFDNDSRHLGADLFVSLPAGTDDDPACYEVMAAPASAIDTSLPATDAASWTPSSDCSTANTDVVGPILDGQTFEVNPPLISQCVGDPIGALDVLVLLNNPPEIKVRFKEDKFAYECETIEVCAEVIDPNDDPVTVEWKRLNGLAFYDEPLESSKTVIGFEDGHRIWEFCATFTPQYTGTYHIRATAFDLDTNSNPIESLLPVPPGGDRDATCVPLDDGDEEFCSRDFLEFPVHTNWIEDTLCWYDDGDGIKEEGELDYAKGSEDTFANRDANLGRGCTITPAWEYYCAGASGSNVQAADPIVAHYLCDCDHGEDCLDETKLYPFCPETPAKEFAKGIGVRYRSFGNTGGGEAYLGVGDLGVGANRVETNFKWADGTYEFEFTYDPNADGGEGELTQSLKATGASTSTDLTFSDVASELSDAAANNTNDLIKICDDPADFDTVEVVVADRDTGNIDLTNLKVDGAATSPDTFTATGFNVTRLSGDFADGFTFSGTITREGSFGTSQELSRIELLVGCLK